MQHFQNSRLNLRRNSRLRCRFTALLAGVALLAAFTLLAAAGLPGAAHAQQKTLRIALNQDPDILDPTLARSYVGRIIFANMCEKLYDVDVQGNLVAQLAAGMPKVSDGGKQVDITLRPGLKFNDGEAVTAQTLKESLERHLNLKGSARKSELGPLQKVEVLNAHTVRLHLATPYAPLVATLADRAGMILAPKAVEKLGDRFGTGPVCVGPWQFVERVPQDRIVLERSPYYYNPKAVHVDRVVFRIIPDNSVRLANLRSGDIDMMHLVAPTDVKNIQADADLRISQVAGPGYSGMNINQANKNGKNKPWESLGTPLATNPKVREALELSIDRDALNQVVFDGQYTVGCTPVPAASPYHVKEIECPKRDLARAKQLLAEAGLSDGLAVELTVINEPVENRVGQVLQGMLGEAGFKVTLRPMEFASILNENDNGTYQLLDVGWSGRPDPDGNIHIFQTCHGSLNTTGACDQEVDDLLNKARETQGFKERYALYAEATRKFLARRNIVYLYHLNYIVAFRKNVSGYAATPDGLIRAMGVSVN